MSNDHLGDIFDSLSVDLDKFQLKGNNPLIFQYTFFDFTSEKYNKALFMIFYEVYITIEKYTIFQLKSIPVLIVCEDKKKLSKRRLDSFIFDPFLSFFHSKRITVHIY